MSVCATEISKTFAGRAVLKSVSARVADGEFMVLLGPSGCGKSTLLRVIAGLEAADSGSITIAGRDVSLLEPGETAMWPWFSKATPYIRI